MPENTILLKVRAWGCKIKSNIQAEVVLGSTELKQGENLSFKLNINFNPDDLPKSIEVSQENKQGVGFELSAPISHEISEPTLELAVGLKFIDAKPGEYRINVNFRHAEYGTQLAEVQPSMFRLLTPKVEVAYCQVDKPIISRGSLVNILVGIRSPAPQKIRGIVFGRVIGSGNLVHKLYELEPKRVSILGDREVNWQLQIPADESQTGKLTAVIEFKSKDSFSKKEFVGLIEIRASKALNISSLKSSAAVVSSGDDIAFTAELENTGLEPMEFEVFPEILLKALRKKVQKQQTPVDRKVAKKLQEVSTEVVGDELEEFVELEPDENYLNQRWVLPTKSLTLASDNTGQLKWDWRLPEKIPPGRYQVTLHWRDSLTHKTGEYSQELCEVKKHHEVRILSVIPSQDSFGAGDNAVVKILLADAGTRSSEGINVECRVFDILNQEVFRSSKNMKLTESGTEFDLLWSIPGNQDPGKYELQVLVFSGEQKLVSRRFSKIINIELPIKLDIHLMLPSTKNDELELTPFLLETEEVIEKISHQNLAIYRLNSNTHLYKSNGDLIKYSLDAKSTPNELQAFGNVLFSYLVTLRYLNPKTIRSELNYWYKLGYSWSNILVSGESVLGLKEMGKLKNVTSKNPSLAVWDEIAQILFFKQGSGTKNKPSSIKLSDVLKKDALRDKTLLKSDEVKLINFLLNFYSDPKTFTDSPSTLLKSEPKSKNGKDDLQLIHKINKILKYSVKFRKKMNSPQLQKRFSQALTTWSSAVRKGRVRRAPGRESWLTIRTAYSYLFAYLIKDIIRILKTLLREKSITPANFCKLLLLEISYYFMLMHYNKSRAKLDPYLVGDSANRQLSFAFSELKKLEQNFWALHKIWQMKCTTYLKNMSKRANLVYVREHITISTNPVILHGSRGAEAKGKLILGNNGSRRITLQPTLALPSTHWNLIEPEAMTVNDLYQFGRFQITPKQTIELPINISFPQSLSFPKYTGILKLNTKPIKLLSELS